MGMMSRKVTMFDRIQHECFIFVNQIMKYLNLHTHHFSKREDILEIVNQYPDEFDENVPFYSVGIHPWRIDLKKTESQLEFIEQKIQQDNCLAVGECGLDKRIETPTEIQIPVFEKQLLLAEKHQKAIIIHCVAAFQEVIEIKKRLKISVPMIIHGFSKNIQVAQSLLDNGFYLSFGKYLLRNPELESVFSQIPNDRFFLETDTIEEGIEQVYEIAANYKGINLPELQHLVQTNFNFAFHKK